MESIKLKIGDIACNAQLSEFACLDINIIKNCIKEMFLYILHKKLNYEGRIYKLENCLHDMLELNYTSLKTDYDYKEKTRIINECKNLLSEQTEIFNDKE